jgi:8-oxo-dGTP pyrophosphatase MutT (NUDIX family)
LVLDETRTKFLLFREDNDMRDFPGGGLHFWEDVKECIIRELKEEAWLEVTWVDDRPAYFNAAEKLNKNHQVVYILFETKVKNINFTPSNECHEARFLTKGEAEKLPVYANVMAFLKQFIPG